MKMKSTLLGQKNLELRMRSILSVVLFAALAFGVCMLFSSPAMAANWKESTGQLTVKIISIIGTIFQVVGVILTAFAVGQLVLAFKNEDADSKARATTMMVVGLVLIALPTVLKGLKLWNNIFTLTDDTVEGLW